MNDKHKLEYLRKVLKEHQCEVDKDLKLLKKKIDHNKSIIGVISEQIAVIRVRLNNKRWWGYFHDDFKKINQDSGVYFWKYDFSNSFDPHASENQHTSTVGDFYTNGHSNSNPDSSFTY